MKRKLLVPISAVLALSVFAALAGYAVGVNKPRRGVAFALHSKRIHFDTDGNKTVSDVVRYVSGDGSWRQVETTADGHTSEQFFAQGRGYFWVDHNRRRLMRSERSAKVIDAAARLAAKELLSSPAFSRTEPLLGHTAYVLQTHDAEILTGEVYVVPEFGRTPVKFVAYDTEGQTIMALEPESITLGEPAASDLKGPDYSEMTTK